MQLYSINTPVSTADVVEIFFHDVNESSLNMLNRFIPSIQNLQVSVHLKKNYVKIIQRIIITLDWCFFHMSQNCGRNSLLYCCSLDCKIFFPSIMIFVHLTCMERIVD